MSQSLLLLMRIQTIGGVNLQHACINMLDTMTLALLCELCAPV